VDGQSAQELVQNRVASQAFEHWNEMGAFVATADIGAAALAAGSIITSDHSGGAKALLIVMLIASSVAFSLAYYSIQVGTVGLLGPTSLVDVVAAFSVAGAQFMMPLWVARTARHAAFSSQPALAAAARHWLGFAAAFAVVGAAGNWAGARRRKTEHPVDMPQGYETQQRKDRRNAGGSAVIMGGLWGTAALAHGSLALIVVWAGTVFGLVAFAAGLWSQHLTARLLRLMI
jgi:hypothetical protein